MQMLRWEILESDAEEAAQVAPVRSIDPAERRHFVPTG